MQTTDYTSIKASNNSIKTIDDTLVIEAPLQININTEPYTVVMRTPADDIELIRGLLYAEDIYKATDTIKYQIISQDHYSSIINVTIAEHQLGKGYLNKRTLLSVSSCGICGKKELNHIKVTGKSIHHRSTIPVSSIKTMFAKMMQQQNTFKHTGGSHACAIFNNLGALISIKEDIGRHNAVDKAIGSLLLSNTLKQASVMLVSGRVSYEIVSKAFLAKVPIIIAVSACSSLAVDFAKEFGICLIGFSRNDTMSVYATPDYIDYDS